MDSGPSCIQEAGPVEAPDKWQIPYEHIHLETEDKTQLHSFIFVQRRHIDGGNDIRTSAVNDDEFASRRPTCIVFHGNAENYSDGVIFARVLFLKLRCNVVLASYRGYGDCTGTPCEAGIRMDSQTIFEFVCRHPILGPSPKVLYGLSLGGSVAIDLASRNTDRVHGVAVENTFLSLPKMLPVLMPSLSKFKFLVKDKWRSEISIKRIPPSTPILFLSGADDQIVPPAHMQQLYAISKSEPESNRRMVLFEKGGHNDTWQQPNYRRVLREFVDSVVVSYREKLRTSTI
ncbi:alpha/beta-hydrolase [Serendipita vermifera]|nr:alpha/beta-hydrolase [Serendipita vermifera]